MAYSEKVVDHYENPRNVGSFEKGDETVGTGMVGAPACGDVMKLQIKVNPRRCHQGSGERLQAKAQRSHALTDPINFRAI